MAYERDELPSRRAPRYEPPPKPSPAEIERATMMVDWAAGQIPNGPAVGALRGSFTGMRSDLILAVALIVRRLKAEQDHG
jgi:hypothetical protein